MSKIEIKVPKISNIVIFGPSSVGKSIVMDRIEKMLKDEFGASVISPDLEFEQRGNDYSKLDGWQKDMVSDTIWRLSEKCKS